MSFQIFSDHLVLHIAKFSKELIFFPLTYADSLTYHCSSWADALLFAAMLCWTIANLIGRFHLLFLSIR